MPVSLGPCPWEGQNSTVMMAEVVVVIPPPGLVMPYNRLQLSVFRWLGRDWWFLSLFTVFCTRQEAWKEDSPATKAGEMGKQKWTSN